MRRSLLLALLLVGGLLVLPLSADACNSWVMTEIGWACAEDTPPPTPMHYFLDLASLSRVGPFPDHATCFATQLAYERANGNVAPNSTLFTAGCWETPTPGTATWEFVAFQTLTAMGPFADQGTCFIIRLTVASFRRLPQDDVAGPCFAR